MLIEELGKGGVIHPDEASKLRVTEEFQEATEATEKTPEPPAVSRAAVTAETHRAFQAARTGGDVQAQIDLIWLVLTGRDVRDSQ